MADLSDIPTKKEVESDPDDIDSMVDDENLRNSRINSRFKDTQSPGKPKIDPKAIPSSLISTDSRISSGNKTNKSSETGNKLSSSFMRPKREKLFDSDEDEKEPEPLKQDLKKEDPPKVKDQADQKKDLSGFLKTDHFNAKQNQHKNHSQSFAPQGGGRNVHFLSAVDEALKKRDLSKYEIPESHIPRIYEKTMGETNWILDYVMDKSDMPKIKTMKGKKVIIQNYLDLETLERRLKFTFPLPTIKVLDGKFLIEDYDIKVAEIINNTTASVQEEARYQIDNEEDMEEADTGECKEYEPDISMEHDIIPPEDRTQIFQVIQEILKNKVKKESAQKKALRLPAASFKNVPKPNKPAVIVKPEPVQEPPQVQEIPLQKPKGQFEEAKIDPLQILNKSSDKPLEQENHKTSKQEIVKPTALPNITPPKDAISKESVNTETFIKDPIPTDLPPEIIDSKKPSPSISTKVNEERSKDNKVETPKETLIDVPKEVPTESSKEEQYKEEESREDAPREEVTKEEMPKDEKSIEIIPKEKIPADIPKEIAKDLQEKIIKEPEIVGQSAQKDEVEKSEAQPVHPQIVEPVEGNKEEPINNEPIIETSNRDNITIEDSKKNQISETILESRSVENKIEEPKDENFKALIHTNSETSVHLEHNNSALDQSIDKSPHPTNENEKNVLDLEIPVVHSKSAQPETKSQSLENQPKLETLRILGPAESNPEVSVNKEKSGHLAGNAIFKRKDNAKTAKAKKEHEDEKVEEENDPHQIEVVPVPDDCLEELDKADKTEAESSNEEDILHYLIVTNNPLLSSYTLKMTKETNCELLTNSLFVGQKKFDATIVKFCPPKFIFVGTASSSVHVYDSKETYRGSLEYKEGPKQSVTALDFVNEIPDSAMLVAGFSGGHIAVFNVYTQQLIKCIPNNQTSKITNIRIIKQGPLTFISSDESGEIFSYVVDKKLFSFSANHQLLKRLQSNFATDVQIMKKDMRVLCTATLDEEEGARNILAISTLDRVLVVHVKPGPDFQIKWTFERPEFTSDDNLPSISLGCAFYKAEYKRNYLLIGWGNIVYLVDIYFEHFKMDFTMTAHLQFENPVQYVSWIADSMVLVLDKKKMFYFVNIDEFVEGKYKGQNINKENTVMFSQSLEINPLEKLSFTDKKKNQHFLVTTSINASDELHETLIMGEKGFKKIKYLSAYEYMESLISENAWLKFLTLSIEIYNGNLPELYGIPRDPVRKREVCLPFIREKIKDYLATLNSRAEEVSPNFYKELVLSIIDTLTELKEFEFLFEYCQKVLIEHCQKNPNLNSVQNAFFEYLEPFIKVNKITYIPNDSLRSVIVYFCNMQKRSLMQKLIMNLDLKKQDCYVLTHLCLENNLYSSLIRVCGLTEDHVTPFVKLLNDYRAGKARQQKEDEVQNYGYRCLWYVKMCLRKKFVISGDDEGEKWKKMVFQLMVMMFETEHLKILFEVNGDITINLILSFFTGELATMIEENYGQYEIGDFTEPKPENMNQEGNQNGTQDGIKAENQGKDQGGNQNDDQGGNQGGKRMAKRAPDDIHHQIYLAMKRLLDIKNDETVKLYDHYLGYFHGKLARMLRYSFLDRNLCVKYAGMFIEQVTKLTDSLLIFSEKFRLEEKGLSPDEVKLELSKINFGVIANQRIDIILDLLKYCQHSDNFQQESERFTEYARRSNLYEVECCLLSMSHRYKECFEIYLFRPTLRKKAFKWLEEVFSRYQDAIKSGDKLQKIKRAVDDLRVLVVERIGDLYRTDAEQAKKLIDQYLSDKIGIILRKIDNDFTKLEILEKFLSREHERAVDQALLVDHIKLLASSKSKHKNRRIKQVLLRSQHQNYPLATCLEICKNRNIKEAWAYLEVRQGNLPEGIELSMDVLKDKVEKYIDEKLYTAKLPKLFEKMNQIVEYLSRNNDSERLWFHVLGHIFEFLDQKIQSQETNENSRNDYADFSNQFVYHIVENILATFNTKEIMNTLEERYHHIPDKLKGTLLTRILEHYTHEELFLDYCKSLLGYDTYDILNRGMLPNSGRGTAGSNICCTCNKPFDMNDNGVWFGCGHMFHCTKECCDDGECRICKVSPNEVSTVSKNYFNFLAHKVVTSKLAISKAKQQNREEPRLSIMMDEPIRPRELGRHLELLSADTQRGKLNRLMEFSKRQTANNQEYFKFVNKKLGK